MILTKEVSVKINESNYAYYEEMGFNYISIGDTIVIPPGLLSTGSHYKILCKCDFCGIEKEVMYKNYVKYDNNWGDYNCRKCSEHKRRKSLNQSYGVDYPIQNKDIKDKIQTTLIEKYGIDNPKKKKRED
jgi:hypothetical protein